MMDRTPTTEELIRHLRHVAGDACMTPQEAIITEQAADRLETADAVIEAAWGVLSGVEWTYDGEWGQSYCPSCSMSQSNGHESECDVRRALDLIVGWTKGQE